jgi:hypothetical protein
MALKAETLEHKKSLTKSEAFLLAVRTIVGYELT